MQSEHLTIASELPPFSAEPVGQASAKRRPIEPGSNYWQDIKKNGYWILCATRSVLQDHRGRRLFLAAFMTSIHGLKRGILGGCGRIGGLGELGDASTRMGGGRGCW